MTNFLRCHLLVISLLQHAKELGILEHVSDDGGYWDRRNPKALAETVGQWNEQIAALFGRFKDRLGAACLSAIQAFPDFERLEARGRRSTKRP